MSILNDLMRKLHQISFQLGFRGKEGLQYRLLLHKRNYPFQHPCQCLSQGNRPKKDQRRDCPIEHHRIFPYLNATNPCWEGSFALTSSWRLKSNLTVIGHLLQGLDWLGWTAELSGLFLIHLTESVLSADQQTLFTSCVSQAEMQSSCACAWSEVLDAQRLYVTKTEEELWGLWHLPSCMRATTVFSPSLPLTSVDPSPWMGRGQKKGTVKGKRRELTSPALKATAKPIPSAGSVKEKPVSHNTKSKCGASQPIPIHGKLKRGSGRRLKQRLSLSSVMAWVWGTTEAAGPWLWLRHPPLQWHPLWSFQLHGLGLLHMDLHHWTLMPCKGTPQDK